MKLPVIEGVIERRILANYRVRADVLAARLPAPFRPKLVGGWGMAGICLIRLGSLRPAGWPGWVGVRSENAAHRAAVEWDEADGVREGVFIWRRDSNSWLNTLAGGRLFPGVHHHATFDVHEKAETVAVGVRSRDGEVDLRVSGRVATDWPAGSAFGSLAEASAFFAAGAVGYSPGCDATRLEGLELQCDAWRVEALAVDEVRSTFFEGETAFARASVEFDCALLMRGIAHRWVQREELCCDDRQ